MVGVCPYAYKDLSNPPFSLWFRHQIGCISHSGRLTVLVLCYSVVFAMPGTSTPPSHIQIQAPLKLLRRIGTWQIPALLSRLRSRIIFFWTLSWISSLPPLCKSDCSVSHHSLYHPRSSHCIFSKTLRPQLDYRFVCSYWTASSLDKKLYYVHFYTPSSVG